MTDKKDEPTLEDFGYRLIAEPSKPSLSKMSAVFDEDENAQLKSENTRLKQALDEAKVMVKCHLGIKYGRRGNKTYAKFCREIEKILGGE